MKYAFFLCIISINGFVQSMFFVRPFCAFRMRPCSPVLSRSHCTQKTPFWYEDDLARAQFYESLKKYQKDMDAFGWRLMDTLMQEYATKEKMSVNLHSVDSRVTRNETWKKVVTNNNEVASYRLTVQANPNQNCYYKEEEIKRIERLLKNILYTRSLCKFSAEENQRFELFGKNLSES